jgi:UDP-N-acetylglucosamine 2-epimerase (non-hydrolysing)
MKITLIAGARPNFMKIAPIIRAIENAKNSGSNMEYRLVHTGQHYDKAMSGSFFEQLNIPEPHVNLECGGGTQAEQTAAIMVAFEKELMAYPCDYVLVVGDVTSTMACAIVAKKLHTKVAHVEGGIRSWDIEMPEEINRLVTDSITDLFFTTSETANNNLRNAGFSEDKIKFVGNTMIDTLLYHENDFVAPSLWYSEELKEKDYYVMTLHRPSNVDHAEQMRNIFEVIEKSLEGSKVIFPVHPRTRKNMELFGIKPNNVIIADPMSYFEFNFLVKHAKGVVTDSGGITEETTVMGVPCITMRNSTERPETCEIGTNELVGTEPEDLAIALDNLQSGNWKTGSIPPLWDGRTAERIIFSLDGLERLD